MPVTVTDPADATATFRLESDGDIAYSNADGSLVVDVGDWIAPTALAGGDYECRLTNVSGSPTTGTIGSWLALSATRTWTLTRTTLGGNSYSGTLEIRRTSDSVVLGTATLNMTADVVS